MSEVIAVICDDIDGVCVLATKKTFAEKHFWMRKKVEDHPLPCKNLRGQTVERTWGWTDFQTLVIYDLSKENLEKAFKQGYKIPEELIKSKSL
jgi:hypothetical protein